MSERKFASLLRAHVQRQAALTLKAAGTAGHTDLQTDIPRHFWDEFEVGGFTAGSARGGGAAEPLMTRVARGPSEIITSSSRAVSHRSPGSRTTSGPTSPPYCW